MPSDATNADDEASDDQAPPLAGAGNDPDGPNLSVTQNALLGGNYLGDYGAIPSGACGGTYRGAPGANLVASESSGDASSDVRPLPSVASGFDPNGLVLSVSQLNRILGDGSANGDGTRAGDSYGARRITWSGDDAAFPSTGVQSPSAPALGISLSAQPAAPPDSTVSTGLVFPTDRERPKGSAPIGAPVGSGTAAGYYNDAVYRPGLNDPSVTLAQAEVEPPIGIGDNSGAWPDHIETLGEVFPGFGTGPAGVLLAPIDGFLGISAGANEANKAATIALQRYYTDKIRKLEPGWQHAGIVDDPSGIPGTSEGRRNLIDELRMTLAAKQYNLKGEARPLQVETLRFMQKAVDRAYEDAVKLADAGRLGGRLSRQEAIGNYVDMVVRQRLREFYNTFTVPFGSNQNVRVQGREYNTGEGEATYRIPDSRVANVAFDVTLAPKGPGTPQIKGFFDSDGKPDAVVIIRPSQLGRGHTYLINRPGPRGRI